MKNVPDNLGLTRRMMWRLQHKSYDIKAAVTFVAACLIPGTEFLSSGYIRNTYGRIREGTLVRYGILLTITCRNQTVGYEYLNTSHYLFGITIICSPKLNVLNSQVQTAEFGTKEYWYSNAARAIITVTKLRQLPPHQQPECSP